MGAVESAATIYYDRKDRKNKEAQYDAQIKYEREKAALAKEEEKKKLEIEERERKNLLKRKIASQKAIFGGSGVGNAGQSNTSLIKGYQKESAEEIDDSRILSNFSIKNIDADLDYITQRNLLKKKGDLINSQYTVTQEGMSAVEDLSKLIGGF